MRGVTKVEVEYKKKKERLNVWVAEKGGLSWEEAKNWPQSYMSSV